MSPKIEAESGDDNREHDIPDPEEIRPLMKWRLSSPFINTLLALVETPRSATEDDISFQYEKCGPV